MPLTDLANFTQKTKTLSATKEYVLIMHNMRLPHKIKYLSSRYIENICKAYLNCWG